jgi:hypothetical protein
LSTPAPSKNFFDDEAFQDRLVKVLSQDAQALKSCAPFLKPDDFKPLRGMRFGRPRWIIGERVLEHYKKYHEPVGALLRAEVLDYGRSLNFSERQITELEEYLAFLRKIPLSAPDAVVDRIVQYKQERLRATILQEMSELQSSGQMTAEKWGELSGKANFSNSNGHTPIDFYQTFEDRAAYRSLREGSGIIVPRFFIDPLDRIVKGVGPGSLGLVLGPRKRGKSLFLAHMAVAFSFQHKNTVMVTLEDPVH